MSGLAAISAFSSANVEPSTIVSADCVTSPCVSLASSAGSVMPVGDLVVACLDRAIDAFEPGERDQRPVARQHARAGELARHRPETRALPHFEREGRRRERKRLREPPFGIAGGRDHGERQQGDESLR